MLRHTLLFSGAVVAAVAGLTTQGDMSHLAKMAGWATGQPAQETITIAEAKIDTARPLSTSRREVTIPADASGHFVSEFEMNGRPVTAMVDTGATVVALNHETARRIGIRVTPSDFKLAVRTANGEAKAASAIIREIKIGRIVVNDVKAIVLDDNSLQGLLVGMSFLRELKEYQATGDALVLAQ